MAGFNPRTPCGVRLYAGVRSYIILTSFNPRTPCGVRHQVIFPGVKVKPFQSTHSLRSATLPGTGLTCGCSVSIHALLAECDSCESYVIIGKNVSIHALLAECDSVSWCMEKGENGFNPRTPCGVRHNSAPRKRNSYTVSIHALLAECDGGARAVPASQHVSIHALLAECDTVTFTQKSDKKVSIHALLAECDCARPYTLLLNRANHTLRQPP